MQRSTQNTLNEFKFFRDIPREGIQHNVLSFLAPEELKDVALVAKDLHELALESSDEYKTLIEGQRIISNSTQELGRYKATALSCKLGCLILGEKLLTIEDVKKIPLVQIDIIKTLNGLTALRERLMTIEDILGIVGPKRISLFLSDNGIEALRKGLITFSQSKLLTFPSYLEELLSDDGLKVLSLELLTVDTAAAAAKVGGVTRLVSMIKEAMLEIDVDQVRRQPGIS